MSTRKKNKKETNMGNFGELGPNKKRISLCPKFGEKRLGKCKAKSIKWRTKYHSNPKVWIN